MDKYCIFSGFISEISHPNQTITICPGRCNNLDRIVNDGCLRCSKRDAIQQEIKAKKIENYGLGITICN